METLTGNKILDFSYDSLRDVLTIEGIQYGGSLFRELGHCLELNRKFAIVSRNDGMLVIRRLDEFYDKVEGE